MLFFGSYSFNFIPLELGKGILMEKSNFIKMIGIGTIALILVACASDDPNRRTKTGAAIGAIAGAVLGHQADGKKGRFIGGALGAITGAAVGKYMDKQQQELEAKLAEEQRKKELSIERLPDGNLKLNISSEVTFDFDSARLKPSFTPSLNKIYDVLREYDKTVLHIVGYTDNVGSDEYNMKLSKERAHSVSDYLGNQGLNRDRLVTSGRGENDPRASNATPDGRAKNRRVEMIIKPIVEGQEDRAYESGKS